MNICVYGSASQKIDARYIEATEKLGQELARRGHNLVFGGGGAGLMGAAARGVKSVGGFVTGVVPSFFNVDGVIFDACDKLIFTETMRERKKTMEDLADAFIVTPGGVGTFEEYFEILTSKQLGRHNKPIVVFNYMDYYNPMLDMMEQSEKGHFITEACLTITHVSTEIEEMIMYIEHYDEAPIPLGFLKNIEENP